MEKEMKVIAGSGSGLIASTENIQAVYDGAFLRICIKEGADFNYERSVADRVAVRKILGDSKVPVLIDASSNFVVSKEGMEYAATAEGNHNRKAVAYYTSSVASKLKVKVFIGSKKPAVPSQVFNTEREAMAWLTSVCCQQ
jgi:hypothetical protein